jgi:hypothetical protein
MGKNVGWIWQHRMGAIAVKVLSHIIPIIALCCSLQAQIDPRYQKNIFTTNTFDADIVGGAMIYFDYPSGKFVATTTAYTNGIFYEPTIGFLSIVHTNSTGDALLNLGEGGPAGASIQGYADKFVVANTNLTFDAVGPYSIRLRVNGSNVLEAVAGSISLSGKTNLIADNGSALTYNGVAIGGVGTIQSLYYGGQYGFGENSITPTNARSSNLAIGTTDIFTVPAGKRFLLEGVKVATTNATSTTAYSMLKTNGVYYRFGANSTLNTQSLANLIAATGDNFLFEAGEIVAVNVTQIGASVTVSGLLFSTNAPFFTPRLLAIPAGNNTLYTCPAGKCAVAGTFPSPLFAGASAMFAFYINDSGGARAVTFYIVPFGAVPDSTTKQFVRTVSDKTTFSFPVSVLFPGDSLVVASDATTATQWARITVAEIPFP